MLLLLIAWFLASAGESTHPLPLNGRFVVEWGNYFATSKRSFPRLPRKLRIAEWWANRPLCERL